MGPTHSLQEAFAPSWQTNDPWSYWTGAEKPPTAQHDKLNSVQEILGLSPNADYTTVRRTLAEMVENSHQLERDLPQPHHHGPPFTSQTH